MCDQCVIRAYTGCHRILYPGIVYGGSTNKHRSECRVLFYKIQNIVVNVTFNNIPWETSVLRTQVNADTNIWFCFIFEERNLCTNFIKDIWLEDVWLDIWIEILWWHTRGESLKATACGMLTRSREVKRATGWLTCFIPRPWTCCNYNPNGIPGNCARICDFSFPKCWCQKRLEPPKVFQGETKPLKTIKNH